MAENELVPLNGLPGYEALVRELERRLFEDVKSWRDFELRFLRGEGLKATTYDNLRSGAKRFFDTYLRMQFSPFRVTLEMIEMYYDFECQQNSPQTASVRISQLRRFFTKFCAAYPLCRNPFAKMDEKLARKFAAPQHKLEERRFLRKVELERLFAYLEKLGEEEYWLYFMFVLTKFLFFTGLRIGEAIQIRWKDIERFSDQDGKERWRCWFIPKGGKDYVSQKVQEDACHLLLKMWHRRFASDPTPEELVWQMPSPRYYGHSVRKSPRLSGPEAAGLYADVSKLVNDSGLFNFQVKFRPHYFRHNLAVYLRDELHWDPRDIQLILRHTSVDTTTQFYFHDKPRNPEEFEF